MVVDTLLTERATPWLGYLKDKGYAVPAPDRGRYGVRYDAIAVPCAETIRHAPPCKT